MPIPDSKFESWSIDFTANLPVIEHLGRSYNCIYTVVDRLIKFVQIIPCFMGDDELTDIDIAQLFYTHVFRLFGVSKSVGHDREPRFTSYF